MQGKVLLATVRYRVKVPLDTTEELQTRTTVLPTGTLLERLPDDFGPLISRVRCNGKKYLVREQDLYGKCERVLGTSTSPSGYTNGGAGLR
jgi:hypothetical protein